MEMDSKRLESGKVVPIATDAALLHPEDQRLDRNFNLLSLCSVGLVTGNVWAALGLAYISSEAELY